MDFRQLGLSDPILSALKAEGYRTPTPIQRGAIPPALAGRDVLGCAQTGTGKTCAFATPILQRLNKQHKERGPIRALVLTPTRELAIQIQESFLAYGRHLPLRSAVIFGGVGQQPQVDRLKAGVDILVATPGRLLDLHGQGLLDLAKVEIFVLDEADRMLDMGFIHDVRRVLKLLPEQKQALFFSATMPPEVMELVNALLRDYVRVAVDPISSPVEVIRQSLYFVDKSNKTKLLAHLIEELDMDSVLVFSRTKHGANRIANDLTKRGISASAIHGNKSQTARQQALEDFKKGKIRALIATDIAARGIDIDELKWVVNYDLPEVAETYVHRIGRTGRAGHDGSALSFCRADEKDYLKQIEKLLGRKLPVVDGHPFPMSEAPTGIDPMVQARQEARENAKAARAERNRKVAEKAAAEQGERERKAAEKAAEKAARAPAPVKEVAPAPSEAENAPAKKRRKRKKSSAKAEVPAPVLPAPQPVKAEASKKVVSPAAPETGAKRAARGVRRGDLSATMPAAPTVPTVDFVRPNPLDSDVIMDATARLLAPRKPIYAQPKPEPAPKAEQKQPAKPHKRKDAKPQSKAASAPKSAPASKAEPVRETPKTAHAAEKHQRHSRKAHTPARSIPSGSRQKDSTEQRGSMMRPYYLSDD